METVELRRFLHDMANALNAAKINAYLLGRLHAGVLDAETFAGLNSAIMDGEKLVTEFHRKVYEEMAAKESAMHDAVSK